MILLTTFTRAAPCQTYSVSIRDCSLLVDQNIQAHYVEGWRNSLVCPGMVTFTIQSKLSSQIGFYTKVSRTVKKGHVAGRQFDTPVRGQSSSRALCTRAFEHFNKRFYPLPVINWKFIRSFYLTFISYELQYNFTSQLSFASPYKTVDERAWE